MITPTARWSKSAKLNQICQAMIADQAGCLLDDVRPDSKLVADLGMDSLDLIETCMAVEEEFEFMFKDEEADHCATVGDIMDLVVLKGGK